MKRQSHLKAEKGECLSFWNGWDDHWRWFGVFLLIPKEVAYTHPPKYFFEEIREQYQEEEITDEYDEGIKVMRDAQRKFAETNNFKIKENK